MGTQGCALFSRVIVLGSGILPQLSPGNLDPSLILWLALDIEEVVDWKG